VRDYGFSCCGAAEDVEDVKEELLLRRGVRGEMGERGKGEGER